MARYGCLIISVILALLILVGIVYLWSGWLNRPVGRAPTATIHVPAFNEAACLVVSLGSVDILNFVRHSGESRNPEIAV